MKLCNLNKCTGCCACMNSCARHAIEMRPTQLGSIVPVINEDLCIECGKCQRVCPVLSPNSMPNHVKTCYAAWTANLKLLENAATAGVVTTLGYSVIRSGGVVFGSKFEDQRLVFSSASTLDQLLEFQGSRYVHSYVGDAYQQVERYLKSGKKVLFTGTPCQVHALRQYLNKEYDNLLTIDLVCHGVAPMNYLNEYLSDLGIVREYDNIVFRGKRGMSLVVSHKDQVVYSKYKLQELFYTVYLKGLISRENCYQCPYASLERYGDITVGDFWGLKKTSDIPDYPFISVLFANTPKGQEFLAECKDDVKVVEQSVESAIAKNGQLSHPCVRHNDRDAFLSSYPQIGFVRSIKKTSLYKTYLKTSFKYRMLLFASELKRRLYDK